MPSVVIRIGAALDADVNAIFAPLEKRAERARDAIAKSLGDGFKKGLDAGATKTFAAGIHDAIRDAIRDAFRDGLKNIRLPGGGGGGAGASAPSVRLPPTSRPPVMGPIDIPPAQRARELAREAAAARQSGAGRVPSSQGGGGPYRSGAQLVGPVPLTPAQQWRAQTIAQRQAERQAARSAPRSAFIGPMPLTPAQQWRAHEAAQRRIEQQEERDTNQWTHRRVRSTRAIGGAVANAAGRSARTVAGIGASLARGSGLAFDVGGYATANVEAEKVATDIANSGFQQGAKGDAGRRQSPQALMLDARDVANAHGFSQSAALEGLGKFTAKTGDLATGRAVMGDMARLSRATGTELEDMINAAGDVSSALGDGFASAAEKAEAVSQVMRSIAGQGKLGAVEISDMASQMAKVAAAAGSFGGDKKANIAMMGALAQAARSHGGAASATSAATSVGSFVSMLSTPARIKAMRSEGIDPMDKSTHRLRDPRTVITEALIKTQGDPERLKKMFSNAAGARPVMGFANVFRDAGGGSKGLAAVNEEFDKLIKIAMGEGEIADAHNAAMATTATQTQLLNNKLQDMTGKLQAQIIPKLLEFAPALTKALDFAASNPGQAAALAIGASIAQAGVGATVSETIKAALAGSAAAGIAGLAITAAVVTIAAAKVINDYDNKIKTGRAEGLSGLLTSYEQQQEAFKNAGTPEERKRARENLELTKQELEHYRASGAEVSDTGDNPFGFGNTVSSYMNTLLGMKPEGETDRQTIAESEAFGQQQDKVVAAIKSLEDTLKGVSTGSVQLVPNAVAPVTINIKTSLPIEVSPAGRSGPGNSLPRGFSPTGAFFTPGSSLR